MRLDTIANNVASVNVTFDAEGRPNPYKRRFVVMKPGHPDDPTKPGVRVADIKQDSAEPQMRYEPGHKAANAAGYVAYPNVDLSTEFVNALEASRAYEANVTMMETTKAMFNATLRIIA